MISKEIVATVIFDSFNEPLPFGVGHRDLRSRQALYKADHIIASCCFV
jgi:hypothetical protein